MYINHSWDHLYFLIFWKVRIQGIKLMLAQRLHETKFNNGWHRLVTILESMAVFDKILHVQASFGHVCTHAVTADKLNWACMCAQEFFIPPNAMPLENNTHFHGHAHLPSLSRFASQGRNLSNAVAILSTIG